MTTPNPRYTPVTHQIGIAVDSSGNFTYTPATLRAQVSDTVQWQCTTPFTIVFKEEGTPVDNMTLYGQSGGGGYATAPATVKAGASGHYHYAVAVWDASSCVHLDSGCPDIICN